MRIYSTKKLRSKQILLKTPVLSGRKRQRILNWFLSKPFPRKSITNFGVTLMAEEVVQDRTMFHILLMAGSVVLHHLNVIRIFELLRRSRQMLMWSHLYSFAKRLIISIVLSDKGMFLIFLIVLCFYINKFSSGVTILCLATASGFSFNFFKTSKMNFYFNWANSLALLMFPSTWNCCFFQDIFFIY